MGKEKDKASTIAQAAAAVAVMGLIVFGALRAADHLRERPPAATVPIAVPPALDASQPPMPAPPAVDAEAPDAGRPVVEVEHATCGLDFFAPDAGVRRITADAGASRRNAEAEYRCRVPDGGVAWSIVSSGNNDAFGRTMLAQAFVVERARNPARVRREVEMMEGEARRSDRWVAAGFLFRSPDRARGRNTRVEGTAHEVAEHDGVTTLTVSIDAVGREVVRVTLPALADDRVVNGVDVVVYGVCTGSHVETTRLGAEVMVPEVTAIHIEPQSDNDDERGQRLLRRLGRHRF